MRSCRHFQYRKRRPTIISSLIPRRRNVVLLVGTSSYVRTYPGFTIRFVNEVSSCVLLLVTFFSEVFIRSRFILSMSCDDRLDSGDEFTWEQEHHIEGNSRGSLNNPVFATKTRQQSSSNIPGFIAVWHTTKRTTESPPVRPASGRINRCCRPMRTSVVASRRLPVFVSFLPCSAWTLTFAFTYSFFRPRALLHSYLRPPQLLVASSRHRSEPSGSPRVIALAWFTRERSRRIM